jgi:hypothetical protein
MTPEIWKTLVKAIEEIPNCPSWLQQQAQLSWDAMSRLPALDGTIDGQDGAPVVEQKAMTADYLDFLREQIELNARGSEWSTVLKNRLTALQPFVGKKLIVGSFYCKPHSATVRINPESNAVVLVEVN